MSEASLQLFLINRKTIRKAPMDFFTENLQSTAVHFSIIEKKHFGNFSDNDKGERKKFSKT